MLSNVPLGSQPHCRLQVDQAKRIIAAFYYVWPPNVGVGKVSSMEIFQGKKYASDGCLQL